MADSSTNQFQDITKELYKKNLELVNANKEMALIQKLYETMALKLNTRELSEEFIETIVRQLDFQGGIVFLKKPNTQYLTSVGSHFRKKQDQIKKLIIGNDAFQVRLNNDQNTLSTVFKEQKKKICHSLDKCLVINPKSHQVKAIEQLGELESLISFPLSFGQHKMGVLSIFLKAGVKELSSFENEVLNRVALVFGVALDRVMIYQDLKNANKELKQLDKLKDEFVSIASHELRTPLTAIKGYLWLALNKSPKPLAKEVQENLTVALDSNERLARLVEDMLTISRIESGRITIEPSEFDVNDLIQDIYKELLIKAQTKEIVFSVLPSAKKVNVRWDRDKVREVITNLIGNALKFTPEKGKITLELTQDSGHAIVNVSDTGPGLSPEDQQKLFQKFSRLESSYQKTKESGSGLGLYISKQIVDLHSGQISLKSELGKGSTFSMTLPLHPKIRHDG